MAAMSPRIVSLIGMASILALCVLLSRDRRAINGITVCWGVALQFVFALLILKTYPEALFAGARALFSGITTFSCAGATFLFGSLAEKKDLVILSMASVIIFVSAMMAVLSFLRILPAIIYGLARLLQWTMRTSGAETLAAAMFVLMGIEAVTGLRTVIERLTRSELFSVMTCFMATIAGSVMAVYVGVFGANPGYIMAASIMNAPAALTLSKIMFPETESPETAGGVRWDVLIPRERGIVESAANGALDGLRLSATVGAMLLAFVSIIHMLNALLGVLGTSFETLGGYVLAPVAYLLGIPWEDCSKAGTLLALKTVFNEWLAYSRMHEMVQAGELSPRSTMILTYSLCSFANFGSLAILIGGISAIAPDRKGEVISLGFRALLTGLLAGFSSAAMAGILSEA